MSVLVVHQAVAQITRDELTVHEDGLGDQSFYTADLSVDGEPRGVLYGELRTVEAHHDDSGRVWERMGLATFRFTARDTIVVAGVVTYAEGALHSANGVPLYRAVLGGTGAYLGANGEVESVRAEGGTFTHTFTLV